MKLEEFKDAGSIALDQQVEVKQFIYCYFDNALKKYNPPFVSDKDPAFMVDGLKNSVIKGVCKESEMVGLDFCFVGTFELSTGKLESFETPSKLVSLDLLFERFGGTPDGKVC